MIMKNTVKLLDLEPAQFLAVVYTSKKLTDELTTLIYDAFSYCECDEMFEPYLKGCKDWSIGLYNDNRITVSDADDFMEAVGKHIEMLATSDRVVKAHAKCQKLKDKGSNLYRHTVENELRDAVVAEIDETAKYYEKLCYQVYCKETTNEQLNEWIDSEIIGCERYPFDSMTLDLTTGEVHDTTPEATVEADQLEAIKQAIKSNDKQTD